MSDRYRLGIEILHRLTGNTHEKLTSRVAEIAPDFARMTIEFPFGELYAREVLDLRTREIAAIAALAALGDALPQLRIHVAAGLKQGVSRAEVVEILMQTAIYAGFPAALNALAGCHDLLTEGDCSSCSSARLVGQG
jgi:4-carboxymuconolactone decarboxylase